MRTSFVAASAFLLSVAVAQPHRQHQRIHQKRDVVWTTEWDIVTETLDITTTVWVNADATQAPVASTTPSSSTPSTTSTTSSTSSTAIAAQFYEPGTSSVAPVVPTPVSVAPATQAVAAEPTSIYVAAVQTTPAVVVQTTPVAVVVAATSTPVVAAAATTAAASSSYGGTCSSGSQCSGDITFYEAGLGACGWVNDGSVEDVIALPWGLMGTQSNGNPYCGMTVTIIKGTKKVTAKVVDKCMGCVGMAIDLSNHAFDQLADESVGRTTAQWYFN